MHTGHRQCRDRQDGLDPLHVVDRGHQRVNMEDEEVGEGEDAVVGEVETTTADTDRNVRLRDQGPLGVVVRGHTRPVLPPGHPQGDEAELTATEDVNLHRDEDMEAEVEVVAEVVAGGAQAIAPMIAIAIAVAAEIVVGVAEIGSSGLGTRYTSGIWHVFIVAIGNWLVVWQAWNSKWKYPFHLYPGYTELCPLFTLLLMGHAADSEWKVPR